MSAEVSPSFPAIALTQIGTPEAFESLRGAYFSAVPTGRSIDQQHLEILKALVKSDSDPARDVLAWLFEKGQLPMQPTDARLLVFVHLAQHGNEHAKKALENLRGATFPASLDAQAEKQSGVTPSVDPNPEDTANRVLDDLFGQSTETPAAGQETSADSNAPATRPSAEVAPSADVGEAASSLLQFRLVVGGAEAEGKMRVAAPTSDDPNGTLVLSDDIWITENDLAQAVVRTHEQTGEPTVTFALKPEAGERFKRLTGDNIGKRVAFLYKGKLISAPQVDDPIGKSGELLGNLTQEEPEEIAGLINKASQESEQGQSDSVVDSTVEEQI